MNRRMYMGKAKKGTLSRLLKLVFKKNGFILLLVVFLMATATFANVGAMYTVQNVLAEAVRLAEEYTISGVADFLPLIKIITLMGSLYLINIIFNYIYQRIMISVGQNTLVYIRKMIFEHMMGLPIQYFDQNKHGDVMSRFTNDVDATRQLISQSLPQLIMSILTIIGYLTAMFITSYILSLVTLLFTLVIFLIVRVVAKKSQNYFKRQQESVGKLNGFIEEMIEGQKVVKVYRHEKVAIDEFSVLNDELYENAKNATRRSGMLIPLTVNLGYLGFAIYAFFGAYLVGLGLLAATALAGYMLLTRNFTGPLNQISQQINFVQMALAGSSRIFEVLDKEPEVNEGKVTLVRAKYDESGLLVATNEDTNIWGWKIPGEPELTLLKGDVRFNNVNFGYIDNKLVLKDISLFAKPGQKIAFVGATGAGKTTITNLINRFYDIQEGQIIYDGIDIKDIDKNSLRNSLGMVLQDTHLFERSVKENIRYGKLTATDEEVYESAKLANAHEFIMKLPEGYDTVLTADGTNLSQGQRQLIAIARAAISNPPVLILDEATSSIDTYTERLIQEGMDKLMEGRTVFVIAHRLSTIKNSKAIILLENGEIVERGKHHELIAQSGLYYQLYTGAFELE